MELDATLATLKAATASVVKALRESEIAGCSREQLVSVIEAAHRASNTMAGVQTVAVAHLAAVEDNVDVHGAWVEQHRGLGHVSLDAPGLIAPALGITAQAASTLVDLAVHQVSRTPRLVDAMLSGDVDPWRARVVTTEVEIIPKDPDANRKGPGSDAGEDAGSEKATGSGGEAADSPADADSMEGAADLGAGSADDSDGDGAKDIVDDLFDHYDGRERGWHETAGPLRARVRRMVARAHPDLVEKEAKAAREGRGVRRSPATVGTDHWAADLPVEVSLPMWQAVEALARELKSADPSLTVDQARADALAQLVLQQADITIHLHGTIPEPAGATPSAGAAQAAASADGAVATQAATTAGTAASAVPGDADQRGGAAGEPSTRGCLTEVGGLGATQPTLLDLERLAATRGVKVVPSTPLTCHPGTGAVISGVVPASLARLVRKDAARRSDKYVVPADMARLVRLRDGRCRFPNCVVPASKTDQDHVIAWPVGETIPINLMCLCRRHHRVKQRRGWQVRLDPDGIVHWTDPAGRVTTTYPIDHLDRVVVPLDPDCRTSHDPTDASGPCSFTTDATFLEIVSTQLHELDQIPSAFEDRLWRHLETTHRGSTLGAPPRQPTRNEPKAIWWDPADDITLETVAMANVADRQQVNDDPPF